MINKESNHRPHYFEHLDIVRFVAAFMIIFLHAYEAWCGWFGEPGFLTGGTHKHFTEFGGFVNTFIKNLGIGVDIFFLLSGFLITYLLLEEKKRNGKISIGKFMIRRTLRIWPVYFLIIAVAPFLVSWLKTPSPNYWANILFVGNFEIMHSQVWTFPFAHFWSIAIEEHFYLIWPWIILLFPNKHLVKIMIGLIVASIAFRMYTFQSSGFNWYTLFLHTISRMDVLIIGAIAGFYYSRKPFHFELKRIYRLFIYIILITLLSLEAVCLWDNLWMAGFRKYMYIGLISLLLLDYNFNPHFKHILKANSIFHYFGKISYGIYMYGNIILLIVIKQIMWRFHLSNMWVFFTIVLVMSVLIPIISYELFEKPILKYSKRFRVEPIKE